MGTISSLRSRGAAGADRNVDRLAASKGPTSLTGEHRAMLLVLPVIIGFIIVVIELTR